MPTKRTKRGRESDTDSESNLDETGRQTVKGKKDPAKKASKEAPAKVSKRKVAPGPKKKSSAARKKKPQEESPSSESESDASEEVQKKAAPDTTKKKAPGPKRSQKKRKVESEEEPSSSSGGSSDEESDEEGDATPKPTLAAFLTSLDLDKKVREKLEIQRIFTVDDLKFLAEGMPLLEALQLLAGYGLDGMAAKKICNVLWKKATVIELAKEQDYVRAWKALQRLVGNEKIGEVPDYCAPKRLSMTCREKQLKEMVKEVVEEINPASNDDSRAPLVCGIRNGTGYGKTHILLNASEWLGYKHSVFLTYNLGQSLKTDRSYPKPRTIGRVLLGLAGGESISAEDLLPKLGLLDEASFRPLKWLLMEHLTRAKIQTLFIGVDEIAMINNDAATKSMTSAIGEVITDAQGQGCTVRSIVTSLSSSTMLTISNRSINVMKKLHPLPAVDLIVHCLKAAGFKDRKDIDTKRKMIQACCGNHPRSVVEAVTQLGKPGSGKEVRFADIWQKLEDTLPTKISESTKTALESYVTATLSGKHATTNDVDLTQPYRAEDDSIPPVFLAAGFEHNVLLRDMFKESASLNVSPEKQLEITCKMFDKFRANEQIPIFHARHATGGIPTKWLASVRFPLMLKIGVTDCDDDIFKIVMNKDKTVQLEKKQFNPGRYYHHSSLD